METVQVAAGQLEGEMLEWMVKRREKLAGARMVTRAAVATLGVAEVLWA